MDAIPWAYFDKATNQYSGIFPDIVRELEVRTGYKIKMTLTPYARVNRELETGRQDCTILISEKNRSHIANIGELVFNIPMGVIARKNLSISDYQDLYKLKISVLRSLVITDEFAQDEKLNKEYDTGYSLGLRKLLHGRVDAIAGTIPTIKYLAKERGMSDLLGTPFLLSLEPIYLQCSKISLKKEKIKKLNFAMKQMRESMAINLIVERYWKLQ